MIRVPTTPEYLPMQCRSCAGEKVRLVIDLGDQPNANRLVRPGAPNPPAYPLRLGYCERCTLLQIDATIPRDDMFGADYVYVSGTTDTLRRHFANTTERLATTYSVRLTDLVVDIGSNDGTWLKTWRDRAAAWGVEPAATIADQAMRDGALTIKGFFDEATARAIRADMQPAKLITSAGSFFHLENLHGACEGVRELLADDGVFVCQAISGEDMIRGNAFDQVLHEHLLYYTPASFDALMQRHQLELFDVKHHAIHGGTWEYHVRKRSGPETYEYPSTLSYEDCAAFSRRVQMLYSDLLVTLRLYAANGKSVWAYGAPGKGGTLLNSFGIGPDLVQQAVEKNPIKFGLEIPGCRVPIVDEATAGKPDVFLVLAWNFLDEFVEKERAWLADGGEFIVPVPEVRVVRG